MGFAPVQSFAQMDGYFDTLVMALDTAQGVYRVDVLNYLCGSVASTEPLKAESWALEALGISEESEYKEGMAIAHFNLANISHSRGEFNKSLDYNLKALGWAEENNEDYLITGILNNIGITYDAQGDLTRAIDYYERSLDFAEKIGDKESIATTYNNIGEIYFDRTDYYKALEYYLKSVQMYEEIANVSYSAAPIHNIGRTYKELNKYKKAIEYLNKSLEIDKEFGDVEGIALDHLEIGKLYASIKKTDLAFENFYKSLEYAERLNMRAIQVDILEALSETYASIDNYKNALEYHRRYSQAKDSLFNEQKLEQFSKLQTRYDLDKKEKEIALLKAEKNLQNLEINEKRILISSLIGGVVLSIFLILLVQNRYGIKKKANELLTTQNQKIQSQNEELQRYNERLKDSEQNLRELNATKDKFFSIISHDLKSPLNSLSGLLNILLNHSEDFTKEELMELTKKLDKSVNDFSNLLNNLLQWSMAQMGNVEFSPQPLLVEEVLDDALSLLHINAENKEIRIETDIPESLTVFGDKNMLDFVFRNLISNAIKFTNSGGLVTISAMKENEEQVILLVKDTGVGISEDNLKKLFKIDEHFTTKGTARETGTGLGLLLCKEFIEKNDGRISVSSRYGKGTEFFVHIPAAKHALQTSEV